MLDISSRSQTCDGIVNNRSSQDAFPSWLPETSTDFLRAFTCNNETVFLYDEFVQWVLSARHTTWTPGWEVAPYDLKSSEVHATNTNYYARVFDLLNWCRVHNLLPEFIKIDKLCHKGMESIFGYTNNGIDKDNLSPPEKPNLFIPEDTWTSLWTTCHKQLNAQSRISSSCIDIPAVLVANPDPPLKVNNPCHLDFRLVDGAHRMCLRKYLLSLLEGELLSYQSEFKNKDTANSSSKVVEIHSQIAKLEAAINQTRHAPFFILNQTTFESMLTDLDPHTSWAQNKHALMKDITSNFREDWVQWMKRVMDHIRSCTTLATVCLVPKTSLN